MTAPGFDWSTIPDDQMGRILALEPEALVREILARDPKVSGAELRAVLAETGRDVSKAQCQRWREAWKAGLAPGKVAETAQAVPKGPDALLKAQANLTRALEQNDRAAAATWSAIVQRIAGLPATAGPATDDADWTRLSGIELDVLHYLISRAYSARPVDEEQRLEWDRIEKGLADLAEPG